MTAVVAQVPVISFTDSAGVPLAGGQLYSYVAGTTTPQVTYSDAAGTIPNTNPIVLNSCGEPPAAIWLTVGQSYKFVLAPSTDADQSTIGRAPTPAFRMSDLPVMSTSASW